MNIEEYGLNVGDIIHNRGSQTVKVLSRPIKRDGVAGICYYCNVIHIGGIHTVTYVSDYMVAYNNGTMVVDVISENFKPVEYIKKLNF